MIKQVLEFNTIPHQLHFPWLGFLKLCWLWWWFNNDVNPLNNHFCVVQPFPKFYNSSKKLDLCLEHTRKIHHYLDQTILLTLFTFWHTINIFISFTSIKNVLLCIYSLAFLEFATDSNSNTNAGGNLDKVYKGCFLIFIVYHLTLTLITMSNPIKSKFQFLLENAS